MLLSPKTHCHQTRPDVVVRGPLYLEYAGTITIIAYAPHYREDFKRLNLEWIEQYFGAERLDHLVLSDPEQYFLQPGGSIFFAKHCGEIVGTCALMMHPGRGFELAKLGVTRLYRGMHIGRTLAETALVQVKAAGETSIFLETNSNLIPAVQLYTALGFRQAPFPQGRSERYQRADMYMVLTW
jgi:ribosomal protein S18 acetylase RimI-like enzyme